MIKNPHRTPSSLCSQTQYGYFHILQRVTTTIPSQYNIHAPRRPNHSYSCLQSYTVFLTFAGEQGRITALISKYADSNKPLVTLVHAVGREKYLFVLTQPLQALQHRKGRLELAIWSLTTRYHQILQTKPLYCVIKPARAILTVIFYSSLQILTTSGEDSSSGRIQFLQI